MKIRTVNDYVDVIKEKYPEVSQKDIKRILNYCWKMIYLYNSGGNDTLVRFPDLLFFIGSLTKNSLKHFETYKRKLAMRIRFMFKRKKEKWDGYYYFARTKRQYQDYLQQSKRRKYITFQNVKIYKLLDECRILESSQYYIFRLKGIDSSRFSKFYKELRTKDAEFVMEREPMNMDDLMVSNNKYKYIE